MNINISCPINSTGYGVASLNILRELVQSNNISYLPIGGISVDNREDYDMMQNLVQSKSEPDIHSPFIKIWHQFDLAMRFGRGKYFALPFFELDTFNNREKQHLSVPDIVFATSEWAKGVIKNNIPGVECQVVPLGVDSRIFNHNKIQKLRNDGKYVFLNIGKWEKRKGHDFIIDLFNQAFSDTDDVELWILASETTNSYSSAEEIAEWKKKYSHPKVKIFSGVKSHQEIAYLIAESDCGLYPSRAEGWNLELLETMSMNKPVIATNFSAHTEYCTKENSYLIDIDSTESAHDGKAFQGQGNWAKIGQSQNDQIIEYMRHLYKNRIDTNLAGLETAQKFSWKNSANQIMGYIS